jgi:hypothetical protein
VNESRVGEPVLPLGLGPLRTRLADRHQQQALRPQAGTGRVSAQPVSRWSWPTTRSRCTPRVRRSTGGSRFLADPAPLMDLALADLGKIRRLPCFRAGMRLLHGLGGIDRDGSLHPGNPTRFADRDDEWWGARLLRPCAAGRTGAGLLDRGLTAHAAAPRLRRPRPPLPGQPEEVTDLIAMRDLAPRQPPARPTRRAGHHRADLRRQHRLPRR